MNRELCHTCQSEHTWIACSGCERNDEYVKAEWFAKKEAEIRADERKTALNEVRKKVMDTIAHKVWETSSIAFERAFNKIIDAAMGGSEKNDAT